MCQNKSMKNYGFKVMLKLIFRHLKKQGRSVRISKEKKKFVHDFVIHGRVVIKL